MGLTVLPNPTSPETKAKFKRKAPKELFEFAADYAGDLDKAFALWEAVYAGVVEAGDEKLGVKEKAVFDETDAWAKDLR
jgi:Temperature dependent protein affecting M2 dsRNA replication